MGRAVDLPVLDRAAQRPVRLDLDQLLSGRAEVELTILMPCLNEAETLAACVRQARKFLADNDVDGEVLVADNGSTDGSRDIAAVRARAW